MKIHDLQAHQCVDSWLIDWSAYTALPNQRVQEALALLQQPDSGYQVRCRMVKSDYFYFIVDHRNAALCLDTWGFREVDIPAMLFQFGYLVRHEKPLVYLFSPEPRL